MGARVRDVLRKRQQDVYARQVSASSLLHAVVEHIPLARAGDVTYLLCQCIYPLEGRSETCMHGILTSAHGTKAQTFDTSLLSPGDTYSITEG